MSHLLIIDLESTCEENHGIDRPETEIIEIGAVIVNLKDAEVIDDIQFYVKPIIHPVLTAYCTALTGIEQETVDSALLFDQALSLLDAWLATHQIDAWGSWGGYDRNQMNRDCERVNQSSPLADIPYLNLKIEFAKANGFKQRKGLKNAFRSINKAEEMTGRHHSGLDDARNMAKLIELSSKFKAHLTRIIKV